MEKIVTLKSIEQSEQVGLYSICINGGQSEFEKFLDTFKNNSKVSRDFQFILLAIQKIMAVGALERFFRPEGKMSDNMAALAIDSRKLRLYCLRVSDHVLVVGNGGVKSTATYEEDPILNGYVCDLQAFDKMLTDLQKQGVVSITKTIITNIDAIQLNL